MTLAHYTSQGTGSTAVFLLHGIGGGQSTWRATQAALAANGYQAVAWDMPGYGLSASTTPYTIDAMAAALQELIGHIGAERSVLLGHSMGGMVAQAALAAAHSDEIGIHGAILYATSPAFGQTGGDWQQQFVRDRSEPLDKGHGMDALARDVVLSMLTHCSAPSAEPVFNLAHASMAAVSEVTYRAALEAIVTFDRRSDLPHIRIPTLCLSAEHDRNAAPAVMQKMAARIPQSQYVCLPSCGHLAHLEQPDAFNSAVLAFLQQHSPASVTHAADSV